LPNPLRPTSANTLVRPAAAVPGAEGEYNVTFTADDSCTQLPPSIRTRTYTATIGVNSARALKVELGGSNFFARYETFLLMAVPGGARFLVHSMYALDTWADEMPIFERLSSGGYVALSGRAEVPNQQSRWDTSVSVNFDGSFTYCPIATGPSSDYGPSCSAPVACSSDKHRLTLTRR
jgi:hypothetical protein